MEKVSLNFESIQKILIATDGSDCSARAAECGISIAKLLDAQILVVYAIDDVVLDQVSKVTGREQAERELKQHGQQCINYVLGLAKKEGVKDGCLLSKLAEGRPYEQIVHLAKELNVDLIVMGTFGRRDSERPLIGSVAERVIEHAPCPVLVVK
jgi:nucleotide-binding universal stress UspA family protein